MQLRLNRLFTRPFNLAVMMLCTVPCGGQTFTNRTAELVPGLAGQRIAWGDYNNDGFVDFLCGNRVYRNNAGTGFKDVFAVTDEFGLDGIWADYNNDGRLDIYAWDSNALYRNESTAEKAVFTKVEMPAISARNTYGASWADYDNNGFVDLYVCGFQFRNASQPDAIMMNNNGVFTRGWEQAEPFLRTKAVTSCDFDQDGDQDIYVSHYSLQPNILWQNNGSAVFANAAEAYGVQGHYKPGDGHAFGHTIGSAWGDIDNDGHIDLFVGNFRHNWGDGTQDFAAFYKNMGPGNRNPDNDWHFFRNTELSGVNWQETYATPALGDYDNDGDLDLYITTVYPGDSARLFRNDGKTSHQDWIMTNVTAAAGLADMGKTYGAAWADFDNDGDLDLITDHKLFVNNGNAIPGESTPAKQNHWLKVHLKGDGKTVNSAAIGTQVRIAIDNKLLTRQVEGGTGAGSQHDLTLHFGLGEHAGPVNLQILAPGGASSTIKDVAVDQTVTYVVSKTASQPNSD